MGEASIDFWSLLSYLSLLNIVFAIILVFFERRNPTTTWLWLMVLVFLPVVGFLLYLFLGQDMRKKRTFRQKQLHEGCYDELLKHQENSLLSIEYSKNNPDFWKFADIIKLNIMSGKAAYTLDNTVELLYSGEDKFEALIESIKNAKSFVHIQYYIFKSDNIGKKVLKALTDKAATGVEVKLLIDGMGSRRLTKRKLSEFTRAGGEVAVFFPAFIPIINVRINYRNHRKICIIDGKEAYIGGFNIGDEYLGIKKKFGYWRDTHIKLKGPSVSALQWRFYLDWSFATGNEMNKCVSYIGNSTKEDSAGVQIVSSGPDSKWPSIKDAYLKIITDADYRLYLETPYFIPDDAIFEAFKIAALAGVDVRIMIPNKPDHMFVYWAGMSYIGELLEAGVRFYTYERGFLHSKVMIMDNYVSSVGTANLDIRSFKLNFEVNAFIYDKETNKKLGERFLNDLQNCKEIKLEDYKNRGKWIILKESVSRLLSPIL